MSFKWKLKHTLHCSLKPCEKKMIFGVTDMCERIWKCGVYREEIASIRHKEFCYNNDKVQIHVQVISSSVDIYILWEHFALDMKYKHENVS